MSGEKQHLVTSKYESFPSPTENYADKVYDSISQMRQSSPNSTSSNESLMNLMKALVCSGILAMPAALQQGGLWVGFFGIIACGFITLLCMHQLVYCAHVHCIRDGVSFLTYEEVVQKTFENGPSWARPHTKIATYFITWCICVTQLGFCLVYVLFVATNMKQAIFGLSDFDMNLNIYLLITTLLLIPVVLVREIKTLAPLSTLANILQFLGIAVILYWALGSDLSRWSSLPVIGSWVTLPMFFGTATYAFEAIGIVLPIENKMKNPREFVGVTGVLTVCLVIAVSLYSAVGFYGYIAASSQPDGPYGSITLNLVFVRNFPAAVLCPLPSALDECRTLFRFRFTSINGF